MKLRRQHRNTSVRRFVFASEDVKAQPQRRSHNIGVNSGRMPEPKLWSCKRRIAMEDHAMSLIRNGYAVSTRRRFLGPLIFVVLGLVLFVPRVANAQEVKQIRLTEKQIQGFMAAYEDMAKLYEGAESDKPQDPKVEAQAAAVAKKNGFANLAEYEEVSTNIMMIMSGIDPQKRSSPSPPSRSRRRSPHSGQIDLSQRQIRKRNSRSSRRRSRLQSPFNSKKTSHSC